MSEKPNKSAKPKKRKESAQRKERTAQKKAENSARHEAIQQEKLLPKKYPDAQLPSPPEPRVINQEWIVASVYAAHTGRVVVEDVAMIWDVNWGRCDKRFLDGNLATCPLPPTNFLGLTPDRGFTDRWPFLFTGIESTQKGCGVIWPEGFDLDMVVDVLGPDVEGNVINNFSLDRKMCKTSDWRTYIKTGKPPPGFEPKSKFNPHQKINNMACLEISNTPLAEMIQLPFMQRQCDPVVRFADHLAQYPSSSQGSLYVLSTKAGSFTGFHIDSTAEVHWLTVVSGEKWVFLLPPTRHNIDKYLEGEVGKSMGDMAWLADQCAETPLGRVILKPGMTLVVPSRWIHAVWTPEDSLALAGGWIDEYNAPSQTDWREVEFETQTLKENRFPNYERLSWLMAEERMNAWTKNPNQPPTMDLLYRTKYLLDFVTNQALRIKGKVGNRSAHTASSFLPKGWRETDKWVDVANGLRRAWLAMFDRLKPDIEAAQEHSELARQLLLHSTGKQQKRRVRSPPAKASAGGVKAPTAAAPTTEKATGKAAVNARASGGQGRAGGKKDGNDKSGPATRKSAPAATKSQKRSVPEPASHEDADWYAAMERPTEEEVAAAKAKEAVDARHAANVRQAAREKAAAAKLAAERERGAQRQEAKIAARKTEAAKKKAEKEGKKQFMKELMAKPREIAAAKAQAREEIRLGKRNAVEDDSAAAKKRRLERYGSVELVPGSFDFDWSQG